MDFLTELERRRKLETGGAVLGAVGVPTDRAAKAKQIADALGITPEMVLADPTTEQEARVRQIFGVLETAPKTSAFMSVPANAAVAHDQTEELAGIEKMLQAGGDVLRSFAAGIPDSLTSGLQGLGKGFGGVDFIIGAATGRPYVAPDLGMQAQDAARGARNGMGGQVAPSAGGVWQGLAVLADPRKVVRDTGAGMDLVGKGGEFITDRIGPPVERQNFATDVSGAVGQILGAVVGTKVSPTITQSLFVGMGADQMADVAEADGKAGTAEAYAGMAGGALVTSLSERLAIDVLLNRIPPAMKGKVLKQLADLGIAGVAEAGQEVAEGLSQNALEKALLDPDAPLLDGLAQQGATAGTAAIIARTIINAVTPGRQHGRLQEDAALAKRAAEQFDAVIARVQANPLTQQSPDQMREFLAETMPGEVHIPAEAVAAFFQAKRFDDVGAVLEDWGIADQMDEALAAKADIVVDAATYAVKIAPMAHDVFREDIRLGSGATSLRGAAEYDANSDAGLDEAARQVVDRAVADQAAAEPASKVFQAVYEQALGAGYTPDVARQYASLWSSRYEARAARSPDLYGNALDAFNASRVAIRQDLPADLKARIDKIDVVINALRARSKPKADESLFGPSLLTFVSKGGGVVDNGGELGAMDANTWHKAKKFRGRLIRAPKGPTDAVDYGTERVAERAFDAGYIAEPTQEALLEAMRQELAGKLVFPAAARANVSGAQEQFGAALDQLDELLARLGLSPDTATNAEIKAAIDAYQAEEFPGDRATSLFQGGAEAYSRRDPAAEGETTGVSLANNLAAASVVARDERFPNGRAFKVVLQERSRAAQAEQGVDLRGLDDATAERLADFAVEDALEAVQDNQNAIGWYDQTVTAALDELTKLYPEIATDPHAKFAFIWALAVTSNGLKVNKNFELAAKAYEGWRDTGEFPTNIGVGQAAAAINNSLADFSRIIEMLGSWEAAQDFMVGEHTVKEVEALTGFEISGEGKAEIVRGAAILGPKIGNGFFSNLYGHFDALTMDRWLMRTVGRWRGTLIATNPAMEKKARANIAALVAGLSRPERAALVKLYQGSDASLTARMTEAQIDALAQETAKRSMDPAWRAAINALPGGEQLRRSGNGLAKYLDGQVEQPAGSRERTFLRKVFRTALARLQQKEGMSNLTMADLQALLWYPEKLLYETAKKPAGQEVRSYEDDDAPDYANAARALVRDRLGSAGRPGGRPGAGRSGSGQLDGQPGQGQTQDVGGSASQVGPDDAAVLAFGEELNAKHGMRGVELHLQRGDLKVDHIAAPKGEQGQGKGSAVMQEIIDYADRHGLRTVLTPGSRDDGFGTTSRARLVKFYKRFGFVENKGRTKDFALSDGMYREPRARSYDQSAYHGSPFIFPRFSTDAIGTGEGAQAYGWGLYFAGLKSIAQYYREALSGKGLTFPNGERYSTVTNGDEQKLAEAVNEIIRADGEPVETSRATAREVYQATYGDIIASSLTNMDDPVDLAEMPRIIREMGANEAANVRRQGDDTGEDFSVKADAIEQDYAIAAKVFERLVESGLKRETGRLYEVQIPEDDEYLLHDEPLSGQPPKVKAALAKFGIVEQPRAELPDNPALAAIVTKAMRLIGEDYNPNILGDEIEMVVDNDQGLYLAAKRLALANGVTEKALLEGEVSPGEYITTLASDFIAATKRAGSYDGRAIYVELSRRLAAEASAAFKAGNPGALPSPQMFPNGDELASKALHAAGIAGIKYLDAGSRTAGDGTYNYVVFDDSRVQITNYEQPADGSGFTGPRGRIDLFADGSRVINIFQSRDLSTLLHEGGHLWLEELRQDAGAGSAAAQAELQIIDAWFAKNGITDLTDQHEAWARATEAYLMEGKAPSVALRPAFGRFKSWLISLYRTVKALNTPIDDEIRGVLDRLIATDEEIAAARASTVAEPMFPDAKAAGMTEAEFGAYSKTVARSREATHDALLVKVMGAIKRQRTAEWRAEAEDLRPDAAQTVDAMPDMRALNWLRANKQALSRQGVIDVLGDESALAMLPKSVPPLVVEKGGVHPDSLAEASGYRTGEEMLRGLMGVESERQAMKAAKDKRSVRTARIDAEVASIQTWRHGDPFTDGSIEREALDAIHHERQGEVLAAELRALSRKTDSKPTPLQVMREWARANIAGKRMRDATRTDRYLRAERKAANAAIEAAAKGDAATAVREKQAQLLNHLLYSEARKASDLAEKAIKLMSRYAKARTIKGMDQDYLEQIHTLLEQYDFAPTTLRAADRRASFAAWVQAKRDAGEDVSVSDELLTNATRTPYVNMTIDELAGLYDAVRSIAHLGRMKQTLLDNREKRDYEAVIDEALTQGGKQKTVRDLSVGNPEPEWWAQGDAALLKVETWLDWLDDGDVTGVFNRLLIRPATDAANREGQLREEISGKIGALREAVPEAQRKAWTKAWASPFLIEPRTGEPLKLQRGDLIAMALNIGNESNLDKLVRGYGWNVDQVQAVLNAELTKEEWAFVQGVWDTLETLWPDIAAVERKLSGVEPERVVPREVETPHGTFAGGYYPAVYDYERSADAAKWAAKEAGDMFGGVFYTAGTPKGHTQNRTNYAAPISLSVNRVLNGHISKVIKRVAYGEFVVSARKFITDKRIRQLIQAKLGEEYYGQLMPWLTRQVVDQVSPSKELAFWESLARKGRVNFQMVAMGFRVSTGLAQIAGLTSSAAVIGPQWVSKGLTETLRLGVKGAPEFVFSRSPEMEQRGRELDRDLRDAMRDFDGTGLLDPIRRAAFMHIGFIDRYMVAMPTWLGAYQKAISQGHSEEDASAAGDKAVRTSQGSGRAKDLAAVQAPSGEFMKLFTLFYSYFNVQYQRQRDSGRAVGKGDFATALSTSFWMLVVAPMAGALLTGDWPDWEDEESVIQWLWTKPFFNLWQGIPIVRDAASFAERKVTGKFSSGYALSPINRVGESVETLLGDVVKLVKDGEPGDRWIKHAIETPGYFIGLPTGQVGNTVQYLSDLIDGDQEPENVAEFLTGLMKGPQKDQ